MDKLNKKYELTSIFNIESKALGDSTDPLNIIEVEVENPDIIITGYANTIIKDRVGDVIPSLAWNMPGALDNYKKNPIILAYHDHKMPIGIADTLEVDSNGLKITARISAAAGDVYELVKAGILKAFSVSFMVKDAMYDSITDIFVIKELELLEISVVSIPANQDSLFSLAKGFESEKDYLEFKKSFNKDESKLEEEAKRLSEPDTDSKNKENIDMDTKELETIITNATSAAVAKGIELGQSGAEKLVQEVEKRLADEKAAGLKAVEDLRATLIEKAAEIEALQKSKMTFEDKARADTITYAEKETAVLLAKATGVDITATSKFKEIIQKYGAHVPSSTWELEVSTTMQSEIRRALLVAPIFSKNIPMNNPVMRIPVNPEAGYATWVLEAGYKASTSSGTAQDHVLKELNLTAYKLATKEWLGNEEEADSIIPLLPMIRDAMVRRTAKAWDLALLRGAGAGADPIKGIATTANTTISTTTGGEQVRLAVASKATVANMLSMRRTLGTRGLNPSELAYVVSNEVYYDLLDDALFQTMDKIGVKATYLTGQVGSIGNVPVILSGEFAAKAAEAFGAVIVNQNNFLLGQYKGLNVESGYFVETQQRLLVASQRIGFQQISTVEGNGVGTFKWIA